MLAYVNMLFAERYKQWKRDMHQYFQTFDDPQVALEEGCPKEFEDQEKIGCGSAVIFRCPAMWYVFYIKSKSIIRFLPMFIDFFYISFKLELIHLFFV